MREKERLYRWNEDSEIYRRSSRAHIHASTYTFTGTSSSRTTDCQRDSHHELLEKSIEYKKSPWCVRRVGALSPPPPSSFPSLSFSPFLSPFLLLPPSRPSPFLPLLPRLFLARARGIRVCSRQREGELTSIHWRSTEIDDMRARTTAKDGDKDKRGEGRWGRLGGTGVYVCA